MLRISNISFSRFLLEKRKIRLAEVCKDLSCNCLFELLPFTFINITLLTADLLQKIRCILERVLFKLREQRFT